MGLALGVALPTGMRLFAPGERALAEAWAINGAFSVLGSALAALAGLLLGSRWLATLALACYGPVWLVAWVATRGARDPRAVAEGALAAESEAVHTPVSPAPGASTP
jgi:hypothetical protein